MADLGDFIDVKTQPYALPANVQRVIMQGPHAGEATQFLMDQEEGTAAWFRKTVTDLQQKITTVSDESGDASAEVEQIIQALTDGTGAYGAFITTVSTNAAGGTAGGSIFLVSQSAPTGWTSAAGFVVNAGDIEVGLTLLADSGSGFGGVMITASSLYITDPLYNGGDPGNLIAYDNADGAFRFGAPFLAGLQNLDNGSATNETWNVDDSPCDCSFTVPTGADDAKLVIQVTYDGDPSVYTTVAQFNITLTDITGGGSTLLKTVKLSQAQSGTGGSAFNFYNYSGLTYAVSGVSPGTYTYRAEIVNTVPSDPGIEKSLNINIRGR